MSSFLIALFDSNSLPINQQLFLISAVTAISRQVASVMRLCSPKNKSDWRENEIT